MLYTQSLTFFILPGYYVLVPSLLLSPRGFRENKTIDRELRARQNAFLRISHLAFDAHDALHRCIGMDTKKYCTNINCCNDFINKS